MPEICQEQRQCAECMDDLRVGDSVARNAYGRPCHQECEARARAERVKRHSHVSPVPSRGAAFGELVAAAVERELRKNPRSE